MRILAVGNSFSQDASTFVHQAAQAQGLDVTVANLYIGGCPLERHWKNVVSGEAAYEYQINGAFDGRMVSIDEALSESGWDVIITQQASHDSGWMDTYEPFLSLLTEHFRARAPEARLLLHQTWAYEHHSDHPSFPRYHNDQAEMYRRLTRAYREEAQRCGMALIPSGAVVQHVRTLPGFRYELGERSLCRDGYHMSYGYGRYLLALVWLRSLCGISAAENTYVPQSPEDVDPALLSILRRAVDEAVPYPLA